MNERPSNKENFISNSDENPMNINRSPDTSGPSKEERNVPLGDNLEIKILEY
jgi:hypothetical protein